jgi:hypothetical protein
MMLGALAALAVAAVVSSPLTAKALAIRVFSTPERVMAADTIVVGKVQALEEKPVKVGEMEYTIAVIKVESAILGAKDETHVRVGFPTAAAAPPAGGPIRPGVRPLPAVLPGRIRPGFGVPQNLAADQEGCFFLTKAPMKEAEFLVLAPNAPYLPKSENFDKEVATVKACVATLQDPAKALKSKDDAERLTAASMLLTRFRQPPAGWNGAVPLKQEPIDADLNKLILSALTDSDWTKADMNGPMNPMNAFYQLGITPEQGFPPKDFNPATPADHQEAMKKWLKDNAGKFQIKKMVAGKPGEAPVGQPVPVPLPAPVPPIKAVPIQIQPAVPGVRINIAVPAVQPALPPAPVEKN